VARESPELVEPISFVEVPGLNITVLRIDSRNAREIRERRRWRIDLLATLDKELSDTGLFESSNDPECLEVSSPIL
jgi:hypothetical protein